VAAGFVETWASIIILVPEPGGIFYMADFHPVLWMLDENSTV
jgi:hypothetical protein